MGKATAATGSDGGSNNGSNSGNFVQVPVGNTVVKAVHGGTGSYNYGAALLENGTVYAWGYNGNGALGLGDATNRSSVELVRIAQRRVVDLSSYGSSSEQGLVFLLDDGQVLASGYDEDIAKGALLIRADARLLGATLAAGQSLVHTLDPAHRAYLVVSKGTVTVNGTPTAVVDVRNSGNAHGRLEGFVNGTDARGTRVEMAPADLPILPGETRAVAILPVPENGKPAPELHFPLTVKGQLEWGKNRLPLDARFAP